MAAECRPLAWGSLRLAGAMGKPVSVERVTASAAGLYLASQLAYNGRWFMPVQPLDKTNEPHGLAQLGGVSGETKTL